MAILYYSVKFLGTWWFHGYIEIRPLFFDDNAEVLGLKDHGAATYFQMVKEKKKRHVWMYIHIHEKRHRTKLVN